MTQSPLEVGAALVYENGAYLISKRRPEDSFGGYWELPGGKKEPTESLEECVIRELKEELDIEVYIRHFYKIVTYHYPTRSVRLNIFLCGLKSGTPKAIECSEFAWVKPQDLKNYQFPEADQSLIEEVSTKDWEAEKNAKYPHEYLEGIRLFNVGDYFECHEMLEDLWHPSEGQTRLHYQGLIQAAIAVEHFRKGNWPGALGLYEKACDKWAQLPPEYMGVDLKWLKEKLDGFFDQVKKAGAEGMKKVDIQQVPKIPIPV
jgi:8-oxo-dGTP diphosphatase